MLFISFFAQHSLHYSHLMSIVCGMHEQEQSQTIQTRFVYFHKKRILHMNNAHFWRRSSSRCFSFYLAENAWLSRSTIIVRAMCVKCRQWFLIYDDINQCYTTILGNNQIHSISSISSACDSRSNKSYANVNHTKWKIVTSRAPLYTAYRRRTYIDSKRKLIFI